MTNAPPQVGTLLMLKVQDVGCPLWGGFCKARIMCHLIVKGGGAVFNCFCQLCEHIMYVVICCLVGPHYSSRVLL